MTNAQRMNKKFIYLDHAAATPLDPRVLKVMQPFLTEQYANPSSLYELARVSKQALEGARAQVANLLGAQKIEIYFTAGATESINLALQGCAKKMPKSKIIVTSIEHEAVLATVAALGRWGYQIEIVPVGSNGLVDLDSIEAAIDDKTGLVSVMYANNEVGTIQPIAKIGALVGQIRADRAKRGVKLPLYLHSDATQAGGYLDLHVTRLGVDLMTLNGSKIYGPKQTGCLYVRTGTKIEPIIYGGGQERGLRSGTENVAGAVGFATALQLVQTDRTAESKRLAELRDYLMKELVVEISGITINGDLERRLPNNVNVSISGIDGESLVMALDQAGIAASTGSACSTGRLDPSHVLLALGLSPADCRGSLRLTLGRSITRSEVDGLLQLLPGIVEKLRALAKA